MLDWPDAAWELQGSRNQPVGISLALRWWGRVYGPHGLRPLFIIQLLHPESWSPAGSRAEGLVRTCWLRSEEGWGLSEGREPTCELGSHSQPALSAEPSTTKPSQARDSCSTPAKQRHKQVFTAVVQSTAFSSAGSQVSPKAPALFAVKEGFSQ